MKISKKPRKKLKLTKKVEEPPARKLLRVGKPRPLNVTLDVDLKLKPHRDAADKVLPGERRRDRTINVGRWMIEGLARSNPNVALVRDRLRSLTRDDLVDRLSLLYCEILGLSGTETM